MEDVVEAADFPVFAGGGLGSLNHLRAADMRIHGLVLWDAEMPQLETREEMLGATRQAESFRPELATAQ
jgi:phosphoribosylformimino-5-aminoimidazole carboxamide ribonucleotide (ProFAR) isomerase